MKANNDKAKKDIEERKKILGKRITEVMELKGIDRTTIRKILDTDYGYPISRQTFAKYQNGENWFPADFSEHIASILIIDVGYLLGNDDLFCKTYAEYQHLMNLATNKGLNFIELLKPLGFVMATYEDDCYYICRENDLDISHAKEYTYSELEQFCDQIKEYALKLFNEKGGDQDECLKVSVPDITDSVPKKRKSKRK